MRSSRIGLAKGQGRGYKNLNRADPVVHHRAGKGMKTYSSVTANKMDKIQSQIKVPWSDDVKFYLDKNSKTLITSQSEYNGKGWYTNRVGNITEKSRENNAPDLLRRHYPSYKNISLFSELNYHSSLGTKEGKIDNYGTEKYTLDYSDYEPVGKVKLLNPVKSNNKKEFGKVKKEITLHNWRYIVINWIPETPVKLQVKETIHYIDGSEKVIFKSKIFPVKEQDKAIKLFKEKVEIAKRSKR